MVHVFKLNGDYLYDITEIDKLESICNDIIQNNIKEKAKEVLNRDVDVMISWIYEGFKVYISGKISDDEIAEIVTKFDEKKPIGVRSSVHIKIKEKLYTSILLAYDYSHYCRILCEESSFIALTMNGIDAFIEEINTGIVLYNPTINLIFEHNREYERKVTGEKLKGIEYKANVEVPKMVGKMHINLNQHHVGYRRY